jgi:hypothetical protein
MAGENTGGLPRIGLDMTKLPLYEQDDERMTELNQVQQEVIDALRKRYENPNWFKVAAGFAKPQLGGFTASLGSAMEALGETEELRRASELPVAQMRLELAQSNMLLTASKKVNREIEEWSKTNTGFPSAELISRWARISPENPTVKALQAQLTNQQSIQTSNIARIQAKLAANIPLTKEDQAVLDQSAEGRPRIPSPVESAPPPVAPPIVSEQPRANVTEPVVPRDDTGPAEMSPVPTAPLETRPLDLTDEKNKSVAPVRPPESSVAPVRPPAEAPAAEVPPAEVSPVKPAETAKNKLFALPNGRPAVKDVYDLAMEDGIPVISNIRTPDEQERLKHHKENGRWYTKEGNPVAEDSKHFTGDAVDIDTARLTPEQRKKLADKGWHQPKWATDPNSGQTDLNHWERTSTQAKKAEGYYPQTISMPVIQGNVGNLDRERINTQYKEQAKAVEAPYAERISGLSSVFSGPDYTKTKNNYSSSIKMIESNPKVAEKVFAMIRNSEPLLAALNAGVGIQTGNLTANINLPVKAYMEAGLEKSDKAYADKLFSSLMTIAISNLKQQGAAMGKVPQGEYMNALSQFVNPDMTYLAAINSLHHQQAEFNHNKEYFDLINKERRRVDPSSPTPLADIHNNSEEIPRLGRKYSYIHQRYDEEFNKELNRLRKQGK